MQCQEGATDRAQDDKVNNAYSMELYRSMLIPTGYVLFCFVASDLLTTICHLAIVNVCVNIMLSIGNTQVSILLLCFLYLFVKLMITMNE